MWRWLCTRASTTTRFRPGARRPVSRPRFAYWNYGGKQGTEYDGQLRLLNPFVAIAGKVSTNSGGAERGVQVPDDNGAQKAGWPYDRKPTVYDTFGSSYLYNSSANDNDDNLGLVNKKISQVRNPSRTVR